MPDKPRFSEGDAEADIVVISPTTDQHLTPTPAVVPIEFQGVATQNKVADALYLRGARGP